MTVTAIDTDGRGVYATASVLVGDDIEEKEVERVLIETKDVQEETEDDEKLQQSKFDISGMAKPTETTRKKVGKKKEIQVTSVKTLGDFVDNLMERNFAMGRRLYLEWRPQIKSVKIALPFNQQPMHWNCLWAELAERKCQDILDMIKQWGMLEGADNGTLTLWADDPESNDDSKPFNKEFKFGTVMRECRGSLTKSGKARLLNLKMRYIPSKIVIDLSSLRGKLEDLSWDWNTRDGQTFNKDFQLENLKQYVMNFLSKKSVVVPKGMHHHFKFYLKHVQKQCASDETDSESESSSDEEYDTEQCDRDDEAKDDEKDEMEHLKKTSEFKEAISIQEFALSLIDADISLGEQMCLELRHNLDDIQIKDLPERTEPLKKRWNEIESKTCGQILDEIKYHQIASYGRENAALWFQGAQFKPMDEDFGSDTETDSSSGSYFDDQDVHSGNIEDVKCESDKTMVECIDNLLKTQNLSLDRFGETLVLEWRQIISGIKIIMSYNGKRYEYRQPWTDEVKKWKPEDLRNNTLPKMNFQLQLPKMATVLRLKKHSGKWEEWRDDNKLGDFVKKLQNQDVRLEGELILLWKHLPDKVVIDLPYFGEKTKGPEEGGLSFSKNFEGKKKKGWVNLRDVTYDEFMNQVKGDPKYKKLDLPDKFDSQLWWVPSPAAVPDGTPESDDDDFSSDLSSDSQNEKEDPMNGECCLNFEDYIESIWFKIRVDGQESKDQHPFSLSGFQTRSAIIEKVASDLKDQSAYKRLYFGGDSQEEQITLSGDQTLSDFVSKVREASGNEHAGDGKESAIEIMYVEIKELLFDRSHDDKGQGTQETDNEKVDDSKLSDLMNMLESKGVDFERSVLHLEWRPSVTSIHVDVSYQGQDGAVEFQWPKNEKTDCESIMKLIQNKEEYKEIEIADHRGIPMLWLAAKKEKQEPEDYLPGIDLGIDFSAADDVVENEEEKLPATNEKDHVDTIRFENQWTLHKLISEALNKNMKIEDHIHLQWRLVPKTVVVRTPFGKKLLPKIKKLLVKAPTNNSHEHPAWNKLGEWKCEKIKTDEIDNDPLFEKLMDLQKDSKWDLWYIQADNKENIEQKQSQVLEATDNSLPNGPSPANPLLDVPVNSLQNEQSAFEEDAINGKAIMFHPDQTLEQFVVMLRKGGIEPGEQLVLEYRRVPSEIVVDLSDFDVNAEYSDIDMDLSLKDIMVEIGNHLKERYKVEKDDGEPCLQLVNECILKQEDKNKVRALTGRKPKKTKEQSQVFEYNEEQHGNLTLRQIVEKLRADGIELQSTMKLKWEHNIPDEDKLRIQFELLWCMSSK